MFSAKTLLFLITSIVFVQNTSQKQIRGTPEVDYPTYYVIPNTSFRCSDQHYNPGFYADTETRCQVFHYCYEHRQESFLCPMGTVFNQPILACDYWYSSDCNLAPSYYHVNAKKRNEEHFDKDDDTIDYPSENLFDKMAHLYEVDNETPASYTQNNDSDSTENDSLSKEGSKYFGERSIENKAEGHLFPMVDEKHPEVVKYEILGLNTVNVHKGSENEQLYETDRVKDFILSEDGMLHTNQEDIYKTNPTDMNFEQGFSGYLDIPPDGSFNYDSEMNEYDSYDESGSDFQTSDYDLQKRYSDMNGNYVKRRPSRRRPPVIIIPEAESEIVQLPVAKSERNPIGIASTVVSETDGGSSLKTYDSNIYNGDILSVANKGFEGTSSVEFPLDESNSNLNNYKFRDPNLFSGNQEEINDENGSQLYEDFSSVISDSSEQKKNRNVYVLSNTDEDETSFKMFGFGNNDLDISNIKHQSTLTDLQNRDESELFIGDSEVSSGYPGDAIVEENNFDSEPLFGSGSEENTIIRHSSDESIFIENEDIFSDGGDTANIDAETYELPMNFSNTLEGSGIYSQEETDGVVNFAEEDGVHILFVLKDDSEGSIEYSRGSGYSSETFGKFTPSESSENYDEEFIPDGSGISNEFSYLSHGLQNFYDSPEGDSYPNEQEIEEINESYYYVNPDSGYTNNDYNDSRVIYSENEAYPISQYFEDSPNDAPENLDNKESSYVPSGSKLKTFDTKHGSQLSLEHEDSRNLEKTYDMQSDVFEAENSLDILEEEYIVDDSVNNKQISSEDLKYLEIMSQTPIPILKNLFEVSHESSDSIKGEIMLPGEDIGDQQGIHEDPARMTEMNPFESFSTETPFDTDVQSIDMEYSEIQSEIMGFEPKITDVSVTDSSGQDVSDGLVPEQNLEAFVPGKETDPFSPLFANNNENDPESKQKISSKIPPALPKGSNQDGSTVLLHDQNLEAFVPGKETDPFHPLFANGDGNGPESKQKLSLKIPPAKPQKAAVSPVIAKNLKKPTREKRFNGNFQTFNPLRKADILKAPSRETFRDTMFTNIPSEFLKMKHSSLSPYFYNYGLQNPGLKPRTDDVFESSKFSKLTALGKRLLATKGSRFNVMKKYLDSYRIN